MHKKVWDNKYTVWSVFTKWPARVRKQGFGNIPGDLLNSSPNYLSLPKIHQYSPDF